MAIKDVANSGYSSSTTPNNDGVEHHGKWLGLQELRYLRLEYC